MSVYTVCILDPETTLAINSFFMLKVFRYFLSGEIEICGSDFSINTCIAPFPSSQNKLIFSLYFLIHVVSPPPLPPFNPFGAHFRFKVKHLVKCFSKILHALTRSVLHTVLKLSLPKHLHERFKHCYNTLL